MAAGDSKVIGVGRYEDRDRKKDVEDIVNQSNPKKRREDSTLGATGGNISFNEVAVDVNVSFLIGKIVSDDANKV